MILVAGILLSGCASSSPNSFNSISANTTSDWTTVTASADATSVEAPGAGIQAPGTTNSLQASAASFVDAATPGAAAYKIGPQDVFEISVFKVPELSKAVQVSEAGTVNLALVGEVMVAGKTARDVEKDLTQRLGAKYLQKPQITVFIKEYNSQRITVEGAVRKPGVIPIQGSLSLLQVVAMSQGLEEISDDTVLVFRNSNGQRKAARFDVSDIRTGAADDPPLMAGDVVVAGVSSFKKNFNGFLKVLPIAGLFAFL